MTTFENKCLILSELWLNYRYEDEFQEFVTYNDLGLPLSYAISEEIVLKTPMAEAFINETFDLLISAIGVEDTGYETLNDLLAASSE